MNDPVSKRSGIDLIAIERHRQIHELGWTPEHDAEHVNGELAAAACCYAMPFASSYGQPPADWPWHKKWWKPSNYSVRNLVRAGALIAAEIDRLLAQPH